MITLSDRTESYVDSCHKRIMINPIMAQSSDVIKKEIIRLLRVVIKSHLNIRVQEWSEVMNLKPNEIRVKLMRSRWGSCSSKENLNFSLNLVLLPKEIVDYIIVHELAHLKEMNHSNQFWKIVDKYYPAYIESRKWLKNNTFNLNLN